jgi:hypothetical protein
LPVINPFRRTIVSGSKANQNRSRVPTASVLLTDPCLLMCQHLEGKENNSKKDFWVPASIQNEPKLFKIAFNCTKISANNEIIAVVFLVNMSRRAGEAALALRSLGPDN